MAASTTSELNDGPVLNFINKRLRALRKKHNRIIQMEEAIAQGKPINKEQEDVLRSKPSVCASIDELEKLKQPLSVAVSEEVALAIQRHQQPSSVSGNASDTKEDSQGTNCESGEDTTGSENGTVVEDLLNLLYFGSLFDIKCQNDFTATMLTRTHERGCCLTYDYVTDDATDLLGEGDLDLISTLGGLLISRPVDSSLSHKNALQRCVEHAKLWLANSDRPIDSNASITYSGLRDRLNKIMASDYFITTPEMKAPVDVAAAAGNYGSFQVPVHAVPISVPVQVEGSSEQYQENEETANYQGHETGDSQPSLAEEFEKDEVDHEIPVEEASGEHEHVRTLEAEHTHKEGDNKEQQYARRNYQNQRGGRGGGGGRRGYSNGRGGRSGGRGVGGGGGYQNGRGQYHDQSGNNYYPRNYYNNRGRGGRGGGHPYNNNGHGSGVQGGHGPADVGVAS